MTSAHSLGLNYTNDWQTGLKINGSYFFNRTENENGQSLRRQYFLTGDSSSFYNEESDSRNRNFNHRLNARVEYALDSSNSFVYTPQLSFQNSDASSVLHGLNTLEGGVLLGRAANSNQALTNGYTMAHRLLIRHKFDLPGRTVSLDLGLSTNSKKRSSDLTSLAAYFDTPSGSVDLTDQQSNNTTRGRTLSSRLVYTEPLTVNSLLQFNYSPSYTWGSSDTWAFDRDSASAAFSRLDSTLSSAYENRYWTQNAGVGYLYRDRGLNLMFGVSYQVSALEGDRSFPFATSTARRFRTVLPTASLTYTPAIGTNFRVFYRTSTQAPAISQLQDVIDNTNPLLLSGGNPNLRQSVSHTLVSRYGQGGPGSSRIFMLAATLTQDYIGTGMSTFLKDTLLSSGVRAARGTQLTMPVNMSGYWSVRSFASFGFPFGLISSNLNVNSGVSYSRAPGLIDGRKNATHNWVLSQGAVVASNVSEDVDFHISYTANYTIAMNTLQPSLSSNYFSHLASVRFTLTFWESVVLRNEMEHALTSGLAAGYDRQTLLWTLSVAKRFLADNRGELRLAANDILDQNKSVNRTIADTYVEDTVNRVLPRYIMLTFTYTMR